MARCVPMASMVTMHPSNCSSSKSSGMAVISLDFSSIATCPSTSRASVAQALTRCNSFLPLPRSYERLAVLPSMATTPLIFSFKLCTELAKALLKLLRVDAGKDATKNIMRRNAIGQFEKGFQPLLFSVAKGFDVHPSLRSTDHCQNRYQDDIQQQVPFGAIDARILDGSKHALQTLLACLFHLLSSPLTLFALILPPLSIRCDCPDDLSKIVA